MFRGNKRAAPNEVDTVFEIYLKNTIRADEVDGEILHPLCVIALKTSTIDLIHVNS